jgi:hypothetical protein
LRFLYLSFFFFGGGFPEFRRMMVVTRIPRVLHISHPLFFGRVRFGYVVRGGG